MPLWFSWHLKRTTARSLGLIALFIIWAVHPTDARAQSSLQDLENQNIFSKQIEDDIDEAFEPEWVAPPTSTAEPQNGLSVDEETGDVFVTILDEGSSRAAPSQENLQTKRLMAPLTTGSLLFGDLATPAIAQDLREVPAKPSNAVSYTLSTVERARARAAWAFIENNRNPNTGFVHPYRSRDATGKEIKGATIGIKDVANTFAAVESAFALGLLSKSAYDKRIRQLLASTAKIPLLAGLPIRRFSLEAAEPLDGGQPSVSIYELSKLLPWLAAIKRNAPYLANAVDDLVLSWSYCRAQDAHGQLQNLVLYQDTIYPVPVQSLGKRAFVDKAFALWGFQTGYIQKAPASLSYKPLYRVPLINETLHERAGQTLSAEPFFLDGLLFEWDLATDNASGSGLYSDGWRAEMAHRLYQVQVERYRTEGIITARADHYQHQSDPKTDPIRILQPILQRSLGFQTLSLNGLHHKEKAALSTEAAFAMWALWETPYTGLLFEAVGDAFDPRQGFPEGFYENSAGEIPIYSLDTNAMVLMALAFNHGGALIPKAQQSSDDLWQRVRSLPKRQKDQCLPSPFFSRPQTVAADKETVVACDNPQTIANMDFRHCTSVNQPQATDETVENEHCLPPQAATQCRFFEPNTETELQVGLNTR